MENSCPTKIYLQKLTANLGQTTKKLRITNTSDPAETGNELKGLNDGNQPSCTKMPPET